MNVTATLRFALARGALRTATLTVPLALVLLYAATQGGSAGRLGTVALINVVIVLGMQIFTGNTGIVTFGHVGFVALGAYVTAVLTASPQAKSFRIPDAPFGLADVEFPPFAGMAIAILVVVVIAAILGLAISRMGGISATMITLALLIIVYTVLTDWVQFSGGAEGFFGIPPAATLPVVFFCAVAAVAIASIYRESAAGLRAQAVREDELAARAMGVNTARARFWSWVLSAAVCAAGGALLALFLGAITPRDFYLKLTFTTLAMLFVGGVHSVTGAVTGVLVITVGNEIFRWLGNGTEIGPIVVPQLPGLTDIFLGLVIAGTMLWRTLGLLGNIEIDEFLAKSLRRFRKRENATPVGALEIEKREPQTLEARALERTFGGLRAVAGVDLRLVTGEVVGLIGPNGSGKSTLLNMLSGVIAPSGGGVYVGDSPAPSGSDRVAANGIGRRRGRQWHPIRRGCVRSGRKSPGFGEGDRGCHRGDPRHQHHAATIHLRHNQPIVKGQHVRLGAIAGGDCRRRCSNETTWPCEPHQSSSVRRTGSRNSRVVAQVNPLFAVNACAFHAPWCRPAAARSSIKIPLTEIGRKDVIHIDVYPAHEGTRARRSLDHSLIEHRPGLALTVRPCARLPYPPVPCSG